MSLQKNVYLIVIAITFFDFCIAYLGFPKILSWTPSFVIFVLLFLKTDKNIYEEEILIKIKSPIYLIFVFTSLFVIGLISLLINSSKLFGLLLTYRRIFPYFILLFLLLKHSPNLEFYWKNIKIIFYMALIQIPVSIIEYQIFGKGDYSGGTFGLNAQGTGIMSIFIPALMGFLFSIGYYTNKLFKIFPLIILFFIPLLVGESKAAFAFIPMIFLIHIFYIFRQRIFNFKSIIKILSIGTIATTVFIQMVLLSPKYFENDWGLTLIQDPGQVVDNLASQELIVDDTYPAGFRIERLGSIAFAFSFLSQDYFTMLFGLGPGNITLSYFESANGNYQLPVIQTGMVLYLLEWGIVGTIFHLSIFIYAIIKMHKIIEKINIPVWKGISQGIQGFFILSFIGLIYNDILFTDLLGFLFWFLLAFSFAIEKYIIRFNKDYGPLINF